MSTGTSSVLLPDPGAQNERTRLAWSRTLAGMTVTLLVFGRLLLRRGPALTAIVVGIGLLALGALWLTARARYVRALRALHAGRPVPGDGLLLLGTAAFCMLLAAGTLTDLLV